MDYRDIAKLTLKGQALHFLAENSNQLDAEVLTIAGAVTDRETFTVNGVVYEIVDISTASSTVDTGELNNTTDPVTFGTAAAHGRVVGDIIAVETEFMIVDAVPATDSLTVSRGKFGSTTAVHAGTPAVVGAAATALTAGELPVPTLDPAVAATLSVEVGAAFGAAPTNNRVVGTVIGDDVLFHAIDEQYELIVSDTMSNTTVVSIVGVDKGQGRSAMIVLAATAATVRVVLGFAPTNVTCLVTDVDGVPKIYDGAIIVTGNVVDLDASGLVDIAATDIVVIFAS